VNAGIWYLDSMACILIAEDSDTIREVVSEYLQLADHEVVEFASGQDVVAYVRSTPPDLCILDLMLPGRSGFQIAKEIRSFSGIPLLFLTARDDEASRITGFEVGADDYIIKPFSPRELVLRVGAILRRVSEQSAHPAEHRCTLSGSILHIQDSLHRVSLDGENLVLTHTEWRILIFLVTHPDMVVGRDRLMDSVLEYSSDINSRTVDSHMRNLRAKLGAVQWIETVRGVGYRFAGIVTEI